MPSAFFGDVSVFSDGWYSNCTGSAMDPVSEIEMYQKLYELVKNKTAVMITHRLGSVLFADRIIVLRGGKLNGIGTHEELLEHCAYYRELWQKNEQCSSVKML